MITRPIKIDEQTLSIWYYYDCGCAFDGVDGSWAKCDRHSQKGEQDGRTNIPQGHADPLQSV